MEGTHILTIQSWNISRREKENWKYPSGSGKQAKEEIQKYSAMYSSSEGQKRKWKKIGKALSVGLIFKKVFSSLFPSHSSGKEL